MRNLVNLTKKKYKLPESKFIGKELEVDKWLVSTFVLNELIPIVGIHPYPLDELMLMVSAVIKLSPDHIIEWGTHFGKSARVFYEITSKFDIDSRVHSIDLPNDAYHGEHPGKDRGSHVRGVKQVKLYQGDGLEIALKLVKRLSPKDKVLFFLDGDHSYKSVSRELLHISKHRKTAWILVHDTFFQSKESGYNIGPYKAVDKILTKNKNYNWISTNLGLPGMSLLYPKKR